ncbi:hypothetical protein DCM91_14125 [Chitinophaga costaii]|nr:hypothetical protein DCM91_14125 [Chitinophaga costaii]
MNQNGLKAAQSTALDQLHYKTVDNSNKLQYVWDGISDPTSTLGDFHEPAANKTANQNSNTADYTYDNNGNLTVDNNKAITAIAYNYLNLPQQITITAKGTIQYVYDAGGNKLRKIVTDNTVHPSKITTTDYVTGMVYQNDTLLFIPHEEGRVRLVLKTGQAPQFVFDYFLKDHLGNIREVLTTETSTAQYAATLETGNSAVENALFSNIDNTRTSLPTGYPADGTTNPNAYAAKLNAQSGQKTGPSLVLRVMAGDMITIGAKAYYTNTGANTRYASTADMITSLLQAFATGGQADGAHVPTGSSSPMSSTTMNSSVFDQIKQTPGSEDNASKPKAYLNFVLFDDQFNMVSSNSGNRQVQASPGALQTLAVSAMTIKSTGFIYIYVSNESGQDVYFDNLVVNHTNGPLLEETHYYPFGLTMAGISSKALNNAQENIYKYNGKELQSKEFTDGSGLELYDFGSRQHDPQIGRWTTIDPLAHKRYWATPYNYVQNNPIIRIDPNGLTDYTLNKKTGEIKQVGEKNDDPDRILKSKVNKNGEAVVKYKRNGEAKVAVDGIEKGILKNGMNFQKDDNVIAVGGKDQPSVDGVKSFTLQLSEYIGKEIKGFSYSTDGSKNVTDMELGKYINNEFDKSYGSPHELIKKYGVDYSNNNVLQEFHTHPKGELGATQSAPELSADVRGLQNDKPLIPDASFIILYRIAGQAKPGEYDYTHEYRP